MDDNKLYVSSFTTYTDPHTISEIGKKQKAELVQKVVNKIDYGQWTAIKVDSRAKRPEPWEDPLRPTEVISAIEIKPIKEEHVEIKVMEPRYSHVAHKGFWNKLKLAFSKKIVYTEE